MTLPGLTGKSSSFVKRPELTDISRLTHGRLVNYDQPNPAEPLISNWLIQNPQRINLGRVGLSFNGLNVSKDDIANTSQTLNLYTGMLTSHFTFQGSQVRVQTVCDPEADTIAVSIQSALVARGLLGVFLDFPYPDIDKFDDPFVGVWNLTTLHSTTLEQHESQAQITHQLDMNTYYTSVEWEGYASISGPISSPHRYLLQSGANSTSELKFTVNYSPTPAVKGATYEYIVETSSLWWASYWESGAFLDLTATSSADAIELQRRVILSQYLLAVNEAGHDSPQESGLMNNGWYGKFHMEMVVWHLGHWARWGKWALLGRTLPGLYERFLPTSLERAKDQGYSGARWGKMSDPTGRSAPGEINSLLIWQQPHPFYFAEMEYRAFPTQETLKKWDEVLTASAEFMVSYAWWNTSTGEAPRSPFLYLSLTKFQESTISVHQCIHPPRTPLQTSQSTLRLNSHIGTSASPLQPNGKVGKTSPFLRPGHTLLKTWLLCQQ